MYDQDKCIFHKADIFLKALFNDTDVLKTKRLSSLELIIIIQSKYKCKLPKLENTCCKKIVLDQLYFILAFKEHKPLPGAEHFFLMVEEELKLLKYLRDYPEYIR
jgi:hypothetical protein